jgi:hypothetical protein
MSLDLASLPTPLARVLDALYHEDHDRQPFRSVHRLVDAIEVFAKLHTVAGVCAFADAITARDGQQPDESIKLRVMLAAGLRTPSLGTWWQFSRQSALALRALGLEHPLPNADESILGKRSALRKAFDDTDNLIQFRNGYAHGATPSDAACAADLRRVMPRLEALIADAKHLRSDAYFVTDAKGACYLAHGITPVPIGDMPDGLLPSRAYLRVPDGAGGSRLLDLYPLLSFESDKAWFYNDLRDNFANLINYAPAEHKQSPPAREDLLTRFPIDAWRKLGGAALDPFRERIEALTDVFRGRSRELEALMGGLERRGFHVVWGNPGVGKSALIARVVQLCRWEPELRAQAAPDVAWPQMPLALPVSDAVDPRAGARVRVHVVEYFIRRGANATASQLFDSINQRLDAIFDTRHPLGSTDLERQHQFNARLQDISAKLVARASAGQEDRLLLIIDGLDEAPADDPLLSMLPRTGLPHLRVLYGARPTDALQHDFYDTLDREHRTQLDLGGLRRADTRALLYAHVDKYGIEDRWLEVVLKRSEGNPLYLRLLCQGLQDGVYRLGDALTLPADFGTLYENALLNMERRASGSTRLFTLLAAARDFVSPDMAAELLGIDVGSLRAGPLAIGRELLYENPLTALVEDYQLFHESLREHLQKTRPSDVESWEERLADWCADWRDPDGDLRHPRGDRRAYAMRHAVAHLADSARRGTSHGRANAANARQDRLLALVEDDAWRSACFEACGDPAPLRQGFAHVQRILRARETKPGERAQDLLRLARWRHDEPHRLYLAQRQLLQTPVEGVAQQAHLEHVTDLARMGTRPREKVMLALTALWSTARRPSSLPEGLRLQVQEWLEEAREPALEKLWDWR